MGVQNTLIMINIQDEEELFNIIGNKLPKKLVAFSIGGTAMMLQGLKGGNIRY